MPITNISIENFKGIGKRVDIPIRPITLLFGANSAGKSTILQALLFLRHVLENREPIKVNADKLEVSGESIDLGGFSQFVHNQDTSKEVVIGVTVTVDDDGLPSYPKVIRDEGSLADRIRSDNDEEDFTELKNIDTVTVRVGIASYGNEKGPEEVYANRYEVDINDQLIARIQVANSPERSEWFLDINHPVFDEKVMDSTLNLDDLKPEEEHFWRSAGNPIPLTSLYEGARLKNELDHHGYCIPKMGLEWCNFNNMGLGFDGVAEHASYHLNQILVGPLDLAFVELNKIRYIGGLRQRPDRSFKQKITTDTGRWANGLAAWDLLYGEDKEVLEPAIKALNDLDLSCSFKIEKFYKLPYDSQLAFLPTLYGIGNDESPAIDDDIMKQCAEEIKSSKTYQELVLSDGDSELQINDVGLGVSQVLPIVVGAYDSKFSIMSVEQPELHIHPAVQCKLADVLAHAVLGKRKAEEKYLLLETHSEHLILRLLRRIREKHEQERPPEAPEVDPDDLSVLYVEKDDEGVKISHLPVTEDGDFEKKWPKGFFEERLDELF
jgi:hypothetical protein